MGTTRLIFERQLSVHRIEPQNSQVPQEFEVPVGETHYHISQDGKDSGNPSHILVFHLRHKQSKLFLTGLITATGESAPFLKTIVIHHAPNTQAETIVRTVAFEQAQPKYEGTIQILPQAQEVESYLNHHSLLIGEMTKSWTLPCLEIEANQVKCSHAATIRTITELDLFYLRSRGIAAADARQLFIDAFISDVDIK